MSIQIELESLLPSGVTLRDAVDFYLRHASGSSLTLGDVGDRYISLLSDGRNKETLESHLRILKNRANHLYGKKIGEVASYELQDYLDGNDWSYTTKKNHLTTFKTFYNWAVNAGHCESGREPWLGVKLAKGEVKERVWLTPEQARELLCVVRSYYPERLIYFVLTLFCGLRRSEAVRVRACDIKLEEGEVRVVRGKTGSGRMVEVPGNCLKFLREESIRSGSILNKGACRYSSDALVCPDIDDILRGVREKLSYDWENNYIRHSFISHHVALYKDVANTAYLAGTSVEVINSNYRGLVDPTELALEYFTIEPKDCGEVSE
jgi:integrase